MQEAEPGLARAESQTRRIDMTESSDAIDFDIQPGDDSEADRLDQALPVVDEPVDTPPSEIPLEADPVDTYEQHREVPHDDDYPRG